MHERFVRFDCCGDSLAAILHPAGEGRHRVGVIVVVGGPQYRVGSHRQFVLMARAVAASGYDVLRFDCRGMGDSEGYSRGFTNLDDDIRASIDFLYALLPDTRSVVVFGLCDAASAALLYCLKSDARIGGLILANPWVRTAEGAAATQVKHYYGNRFFERTFWSKLLTGKVELRKAVSEVYRTLWQAWGRSSAMQRPDERFVDSMLEGLRRFPGQVLLVQSERDLTAREFDELSNRSPGWAEQITSPRVSRVDLAGADHTFSSASALEKVSSIMIHWLKSIGTEVPLR